MPKSTVLFRLALLTSISLALWISAANAYTNYSTNGSSGNCATCHGNFITTPYTSLADGTSWGDDLHDVHRNTMLNGDCDACHAAGGRSPVSLSSSVGGTGLDPISCLGCHGREEGANGITGSGLRQHHLNTAAATCYTASCHSAESETFNPVGEHVLPPYYAIPDAAHPSKPTDPCNPNGEEDFAATTIGLDNDGDGMYDQGDTNCVAVINLNPAALDFGEVPTGNSVTLNTQVQNLSPTVELNVTLINLCPGTSTEFSWTPDAPFTLTPGTSQVLAVTYAPVDEGLDSGCLAISSNDPNEAIARLQLNKAESILNFLPAIIQPDQNGTQ